MEESLNKIYDELICRLYKPLIFYMPRKLWVEFDGKKWNDKQYDELFDTVVLIKGDGKNHALKNEPSYYHILGKTQALDKNTYTLIEVKAKLETSSFEFVIDKYCQYINFYIRVSVWLTEHVEKDIAELSQETLNSFVYQKEAFEKHRDYLQKSFLTPKQKQDEGTNKSLTEEDLKSIRTLLNVSDEVTTKEGIISSDFEPPETTKKAKKEKTVLMTEEEAEKYLLRTVFNVKL